MDKNLMTPKEEARKQLHDKICGQFVKMQAENPTAKNWRFITRLSRQHSYTPQGIYSILRRNNLID